MPKIAICGSRKSGKDTLASLILQNRPNWCRVSFAYPLKTFLLDVFSLPPDTVWGPSSMREVQALPYPEEARHYKWSQANVNFRSLYASWAYDLGVSGAHTPEMHTKLYDWFTRMENDEPKTTRDLLYTLGKVVVDVEPTSLIYSLRCRAKFMMLEGREGIVVTDVRTKKEFEALKNDGYYMVRLDSDEARDSTWLNNSMETVADDQFDHIIHNNMNGVHELYEDVDLMIRKAEYPW